MHGRLALRLLLVLGCASGCAGIPDHDYLRVGGAARPEYAAPPPDLSLAEKAVRFERHLDRFISPEGTLIYRRTSLEPGKPAPPLDYGTFADTAIWTGALLGAESLRYAVTRDPAALARVRALVGGLERLHDVTGVRGLFARTIVRREAPDPRESTDGAWRAGTGEFAGYRWRGDVSKDQYSGVIFGLGLSALLVDDAEVRARAARLSAAIADHLVANEERIVDVGGETTTYGDLRGRIAGVPIGLNALIVLAAYKVAAHTNRDERRHAEAYAAAVARGYADIAYWAKFQVLGITNPNNDNMQMLVTVPLLALERDPSLRRAYERSIERTLRHVRREGNAFFNLVGLQALGYDRDLHEDALLTLRLFPLERRIFAVDATGDARFATTLLDNRKGVEKADGALPVNYRPASAWAWRDDPYALRHAGGAVGEVESPAADFILAYWLGRWLGYVRARD